MENIYVATHKVTLSVEQKLLVNSCKVNIS